MSCSPDDERFWKEHGIDPAIAAARPYVRYTREDREPVRDEYAPLSRGQRSYMTRVAGKRWCPKCKSNRESDDCPECGCKCESGGYVIKRHAPRGLRLSHVYAELRPDKPVKTRPPTWHFHPTDPSDEIPTYPSGKPLLEKHIYTAKSMWKNGHIDRAKSKDDHCGKNAEVVHKHEHEGKYLFCPSGKVPRTWSHDHDEDYAGKPEKRAAHVNAKSRHNGVDVIGRHDHVDMVKDRDEKLAKRIDVHPWGRSRLSGAKRIFFAIEGCIKADAILTAGEAVFSVPSVTLWDAEELEEVASRYLLGPLVVIVPDADAFLPEKKQVLTQSLLCRTFLSDHCGVNAIVAAPPPEGLPEIKGVDDFLVAGGDLDDLVVFDREESPGLAEWVRLHSKRRDAIVRDAQALRGLVLHAGADGRFVASLGMLARVVRMEPRRIARAVQSLVDMGAVTIDTPLRVQEGRWRTNRYFDPSLDWEDRPTIEVIEELRADPPTMPRLREVKGRVRYDGGSGEDAVAIQDAFVRAWHREGYTLEEVVRMTTLSRSSVKRILAASL
ncbi:MAG: DUF3854 domain-containing protein [Actinomycetota bacterium]|nr:DUF3854 domain-containing protein [Actinomycetota bacterium]